MWSYTTSWDNEKSRVGCNRSSALTRQNNLGMSPCCKNPSDVSKIKTMNKEQMEDTLLELIENNELTEFQLDYILKWLSGNGYVN